MSSRPLWAARAPQHACARGTTTRHPFLASTRIVARFTPRNHRSCTHPLSSATVPRSWPTGGVSRGRRRNKRGPFRGERADAFREREACERLHRRGEPQQLLPRERDVEPEPPEEPRPPRPQRLDLDARAFDHPSERHVRRTDVLAGPARETQIHEARERLVGFGPALGHRTHRRDPATGRRRLLAGHAVGGAVRQAQPARNACCQVRVGRSVEREPPPRSEFGRRTDEPHPVGHLAAERDAAVRLVAFGAHVTDARPRPAIQLGRTGRGPGRPRTPARAVVRSACSVGGPT